MIFAAFLLGALIAVPLPVLFTTIATTIATSLFLLFVTFHIHLFLLEALMTLVPQVDYLQGSPLYQQISVRLELEL